MYNPAARPQRELSSTSWRWPPLNWPGNSVVKRALRDPAGFPEIMDRLFYRDSLVRMCCADVAKKISRVHPEWLQLYKRKLFDLAHSSAQLEVRWHLAQMRLERLPRSGIPAMRARARKLAQPPQAYRAFCGSFAESKAHRELSKQACSLPCWLSAVAHDAFRLKATVTSNRRQATGQPFGRFWRAHLSRGAQRQVQTRCVDPAANFLDGTEAIIWPSASSSNARSTR